MPLVVVGTPIGNLGDLSPRAEEELRTADLVACEDTRRTGSLLAHRGIEARGRLRSVHGHNEAASTAWVLEAVRSGQRVAFVSDAGMPGVSDPGARLVRACHAAGLAVLVVPGPSAVSAALALSGFDADRYVFEGFLARRGRPREEALERIAAEPRTVVIFEAPTRVAATLAALAGAGDADRPVAIARELTKLHEEIWVGRLGDAHAQVDSGPPRGEYVLVLGPRVRNERVVTDDEVLSALRDAMARGTSARDAASEVARALGVARRRAYDLAVTLRSP